MVKGSIINLTFLFLLLTSISVLDKSFHNYEGRPYQEFKKNLSEKEKKDLLTIMTYNIRFEDLDHGKQSWRYRKEKLINNIILKLPDILSIQEDSKDQVEYINEKLKNYNYNYIGVDEYNLPNERQRNTIFYKKNKFELINQKSIWLNEKEIKDAIGWDGWNPRSANIIILKKKENNQKIIIANVHLDHKGRKSRLEGMKLVLNYLDKISINYINNSTRKIPIFLMGDFNEFPKQYTYNSVIDRNYIDMWNTCVKFNKNNKCILGEQFFGSFHWYLGSLVNNYFLRKLLMPISFQHSGGKFSQWEQYHIDHMFYINGNGTNIIPIYASMPCDDLKMDKSGIFASDHFPLFAVFKLN
jgi:endonuclease/exonuclease/phosphatase family metal-dependent hydrolase